VYMFVFVFEWIKEDVLVIFFLNLMHYLLWPLFSTVSTHTRSHRVMPPPDGRRLSKEGGEIMSPSGFKPGQRSGGEPSSFSVSLRTLSGGDGVVLTPSFSADRGDMGDFHPDDFHLTADDVTDVDACFEFSAKFSPASAPLAGSPHSKRTRGRGASAQSSPNYVKIDPAATGTTAMMQLVGAELSARESFGR